MPDASILIEYLLRTDRGAPMEQLVAQPGLDLHIPSLCDVEVAAVLRRGMLSGRLRPARARTALMDYLDLPLQRHGHIGLLERTLELRENFTAYDAVYVALAERIGASLLSAAEALNRAVRTHSRVAIAVVEKRKGPPP